uniref:growth-regulating factor 8-like n=1 Tax=Erigeron canadensis TaxID=72917 RepID=UPI001CB92E9D|nr:growth-regulating factor 8-like [Erigeron canadensis]
MSSDNNHKTVDDGSGNEISGKPPSSQAECDVGLALNMQHTHPSKKINLMPHPSPYHNHPKYHQTSIEFGGGGRQVFEPSSNHIAFATSPNYTTGGVIFTASQLQELENQTMIYKHIMSSIPVPPQLLFPFSSQSNRSDSEPWRCRRTDGKKWRCSRDVMPDQKYCERHAHKNRPRSRKHVETHQSQTQITHNSSKHLSSSTKDNYNTTLPHSPTMSPSCQQSSLLMKNGTIPLSSSNQKIQKPSVVGSKGDHFFQDLGGRSSHDHDLVGDNCFLSLMQPGGNDNNSSDDQDDLFQLGIGMLNADDSNTTHNQWAHQGSWLGGPLGEALCLGVASSLNQPPNVTSSHDVSHHGLHD